MPIAAAAALAALAAAQQPKLYQDGSLASMDDVDLGTMVRSVPAQNIFSDPGYHIWCGSVTEGKNGKFSMFYSRWPKADGHYGWVTSSEIALAVADKPEGPYKHVKVVLPPRGSQFWDGTTTHNPAVIRHQGKYYRMEADVPNFRQPMSLCGRTLV